MKPQHVMYLNSNPEPIPLNFPEYIFECLNLSDDSVDTGPFHNCIFEMYPDTEDVCIDRIEYLQDKVIYHISTTNKLLPNGMWN